jgi:integration host factor beta subunit
MVRIREQGMTKAELVEIISQQTGVSKKDTGLIVNLIMENIGQALVSGDKVELRGFGSFKVKTRRARLARNPRTGAAVNVPAKRVPYFKSSNELKGRLNNKD